MQNLQPQRQIDAVRPSFLRQVLHRSVGFVDVDIVTMTRRVNEEFTPSTLNYYSSIFSNHSLNLIIDSISIMETVASFWNKIQMPSFMHVLWYKIAGTTPSGTLRKVAVSPDRMPLLNSNCQLVTTPETLFAFCRFLQAFYNTNNKQSGPAPISTLTPDLARQQNLRPIILLQPDVSGSGNLAGCISSQPIGKICQGAAAAAAATANIEINLISNYCVHPTLRKKGIGGHLLNAVWHNLIQSGEDACIFLKEGSPLLSAGPPLMSGTWIYRYCDTINHNIAIRHIKTHIEADSLIEKYAANKPNVLYNKGNNCSKTRIYEYKGLRGSILAAFSAANQVHSVNRRPIYYQTGWLEQGDILLTERVMAARAISDSVGVAAGGAWVWCDCSVINNTVITPWRLDGPYHYYAFQWTADLYGNAVLFLRI